MSKLILLGLVVAWAVVLAPDLLRRINGGRRGNTIRSFSEQISSLGSMNRSAEKRRAPSGRPAAAAVRQSPTVPAPDALRSRPARAARPSVDARRRRQDVLVSLGAAALVTLLATVAFGGPFLALHLLVDAALVAYLVLLAQVTSSAPQRSVAHRAAGAAPTHTAASRPAPVPNAGAGPELSSLTLATNPRQAPAPGMASVTVQPIRAAARRIAS